ncbi:transposable element Tcb1 transposase [Trichonephila clavipes]|nr:transposable element Tcb1 transposase [Trichonephila clavipes]
MASSGVRNLHFIDGIMNTYVYLDILKRNLRQSVSKISGHFKLYQDNDPKHTVDFNKLWGFYNHPSVIKTPARSPDLNLNQHVWDYLLQKLYEHQISNKQDLRNIWSKTGPKFKTRFAKKNDQIPAK